MKRLLWVMAFACLVSEVQAADEAGLAALDAAQARWRAAAVSDYVYAYRKYCECNKDIPPETFVTVADNKITRVYHLHVDSDREVPAREGSLGDYWTIDDLFAKLQSALSGDAEVQVEYDPTYGYPTRLYIDYRADFAGDETDLRMTQFERQ